MAQLSCWCGTVRTRPWWSRELLFLVDSGLSKNEGSFGIFDTLEVGLISNQECILGVGVPFVNSVARRISFQAFIVFILTVNILFIIIRGIVLHKRIHGRINAERRAMTTSLQRWIQWFDDCCFYNSVSWWCCCESHFFLIYQTQLEKHEARVHVEPDKQRRWLVLIQGKCAL